MPSLTLSLWTHDSSSQGGHPPSGRSLRSLGGCMPGPGYHASYSMSRHASLGGSTTLTYSWPLSRQSDEKLIINYMNYKRGGEPLSVAIPHPHIYKGGYYIPLNTKSANGIIITAISFPLTLPNISNSLEPLFLHITI